MKHFVIAVEAKEKPEGLKFLSSETLGPGRAYTTDPQKVLVYKSQSLANTEAGAIEIYIGKDYKVYVTTLDKVPGAKVPTEPEEMRKGKSTSKIVKQENIKIQENKPIRFLVNCSFEHSNVPIERGEEDEYNGDFLPNFALIISVPSKDIESMSEALNFEPYIVAGLKALNYGKHSLSITHFSAQQM